MVLIREIQTAEKFYITYNYPEISHMEIQTLP